MDTNSTAAPLLGRCKQCDYAIFATREDVKTADSLSGVTAGTGVYRVNNGHVARCVNNHKVFPVRAIKGTYSKDHKCDSRCLNAKGHDCTCSCGGMNHGRGHAVTVVEASAAPVDPPASFAQVNFIKALMRRVLTDEQREAAQPKLDAGLTKKQASAWITRLKEIEEQS